MRPAGFWKPAIWIWPAFCAAVCPVSVKRLAQCVDDFRPAKPLDQAGGLGFGQQGMQRGQAAWWFVHRRDTVGPEERLGKPRDSGGGKTGLLSRQASPPCHATLAGRFLCSRTGSPASATIQNFPSSFSLAARLAIRYPETPVVMAAVATNPSATTEIRWIGATAVGNFDLSECGASVIVTEPGISGPGSTRDHDAEHQAGGGI